MVGRDLPPPLLTTINSDPNETDEFGAKCFDSFYFHDFIFKLNYGQFYLYND